MCENVVLIQYKCLCDSDILISVCSTLKRFNKIVKSASLFCTADHLESNMAKTKEVDAEKEGSNLYY